LIFEEMKRETRKARHKRLFWSAYQSRWAELAILVVCGGIMAWFVWWDLSGRRH
jgi:hypothetical protein